jgi:hypothetical protein
MYTVKPLADNIEIINCVESSGEQGTACFGISVVFRMTFALFCFHVLMLLLILPRNGCASVIHDSGWIVKFLLITALFTIFFWVPISVFQIWGEISRYVSILFFIVMAFYVLIGAYSFNSYIVESSSNDENWKLWSLMIYSCLLQAGSIALIVGCFYWFLGPT